MEERTSVEDSRMRSCCGSGGGPVVLWRGMLQCSGFFRCVLLLFSVYRSVAVLLRIRRMCLVLCGGCWGTRVVFKCRMVQVVQVSVFWSVMCSNLACFGVTERWNVKVMLPEPMHLNIACCGV